jgi:SAM-dependent methyltransferase
MDLNTVTLRHPLTLAKLAVRKFFRSLALRAARKGSGAGEAVTEQASRAEAPIDVRELISRSSLEELNVAAENYFAGLSGWDDHLAKPFSRAEDAPGLLINLGVLLQGLELAPGLRVLDFGAGTGWISRYLTQLGCEVVLLDVSETALAIAAESYRRQPVFGSQPAPRFLRYDGRRIDLPDGSIDRIVSFDAFHHATNPDSVLAEFGRILVPGGIAAFAEPGPDHSRRPQSQSEMRTYGVVENDVDIHAIWRAAEAAGFSEIRVAAFNVPPYHMTLRQFDDLLEGGEAYLRWAESTRHFLYDVRNFFLTRRGEQRLDSRQARGLSASIEISMPPAVTAGASIPVRATVINTGSAIWLPSATERGGVSLGCHLYRDGKLVSLDFHWERLSQESVPPGETVELRFDLPPLAGECILEFDCVANRICWFAEAGSRSIRVAVNAGENGATS